MSANWGQANIACRRRTHGRFFVLVRSTVSRILVAVLFLQHFAFVVPEAHASASVVVQPIVASGNFHTAFLKSDGTVWAAGAKGDGQLGDGINGGMSATAVQVHGPGDVGFLTGIKTIAAGGYFTLALKYDGTVWAWGNNAFSQLGDGTTTGRNTPVAVSGLAGVVAISAGQDHAVALKYDGTVWAWGNDDYGKIGDNTVDVAHPVPVQVHGPGDVGFLTNIIAVAAGSFHTVALKNDGTVWTWGRNTTGQLGNASGVDSAVPVQVHGPGDVGFLTGIKSLTAMASHVVALKHDGTVWTWGGNGNGQLGDATTTNRNVPVQVRGLGGAGFLTGVSAVTGDGSFSIALKVGGTIVAWGDNGGGFLGDGTTTQSTVPVETINLSGVIAITSGLYHTFALKSNGAVWAWGNNANGEFGDGTTTSTNSPALSSINLLAGTTTVVEISSGFYHIVARKVNGTVWAWGNNAFGQLGDGTTTNRNAPVQVTGLSAIAAVASGGAHTIALKSDGTVRAWGANDQGQLGNGGNVDSSVPVVVTGLTNVVAVAAGYYVSYALKSDGTVWAWGRNVEGQVGDGTNVNRNTPVAVSGGLSGVIAIAGGLSHALALKSDGTVRAWGRGIEGQLGNGANANSNVPVVVTGLSNVTAVSGGGFHSLALKNDGTARSWGYNLYGALGDFTNNDSNVAVSVTGLTDLAEVAAGGYHSVARRVNGTVRAWGRNANGQLGNESNVDSNVFVDVSNITTATAIGAGYYHSAARVVNGSVWAWGRNTEGELGNGLNVDSNVAVQADFSGGGGGGGGGGVPNNTFANRVVMSRLKAGVVSSGRVTFTIPPADAPLSGVLTVTFPAAFTMLSAPTGGGSSPCLGAFAFNNGTKTVSATKTACSGTIFLGGFTVQNPVAVGMYRISWVNDDPGETVIAIVSSDQPTVSARIAPSVTFDLNVGATNAANAAPYTIPLTVVRGTVKSSDNGAVPSIWVNLTTNGPHGAVVTVKNINGASGLQSVGVPANTIPNAAAVMSSTTPNYGLCVNDSATTAVVGTFQAAGPYAVVGVCVPNGAVNRVEALSAITPTALFNSAGSYVGTGVGEVIVNVNATNATALASDYADTLTFAASATF